MRYIKTISVVFSTFLTLVFVATITGYKPDNIEKLEIQTFDLGFSNSDHQPVYLLFNLS